MGRVDDAFDRALDRPVAIKHMLSASAVDLARFEREARITARLEHPGIVPIHDAGRGPDGTPYYVMRRVDGKPLDQCVAATLAERLALIPNVLAACDAVGFAHARGVVHRDIKPTNILVGPFGETLVIDWGLAREIGERDGAGTAIPASDPELTRAGTVAGTPGFMAPEQARGEAVDARADVFALGATLFYVLAGQPPYGSASATQMIDFAGAGRAPDWKALPAAVPPELRAIAGKAMASDAADRYADATALAADLRRFITGNLVGAYEYGPLARFARFVRRHRAAVAVATISAIVVVVGTVLSVRRIVAERDDANSARAIAETRQHEATAMADRLLVQHALELAPSDPVAAIVALRTLAPTSSKWHEARIAAEAAYAQAIPFGFATRDAMYMQINADNRRALVSGQRDGELSVVDLRAHTRRIVATTGTSPYGAAWIGPSHIAVGYPDHVAIVDIEHGTTRSVPIALRHLIGDRASKVWIFGTGAQLLELVGPDGTPREIATHVENVATSRDFTQAVIQHDGVIEAWTPTAHIHLADNPKRGETWSTVAAIEGNRVIMYADSTLFMWRLEGDKAIDEGKRAAPYTFSVDILDGNYAYTSPTGLMEIRNGRDVEIAPSRGTMFPTPHGLAVLDTGSVTLFDERGWFPLAHRATQLQRVDASPDGRFAIATTGRGETLVWDLQHIHSLRYQTHERDLLRLTEHYLWLQTLGAGVVRMDRTTGQIEELFTAMVDGRATVTQNETAIMGRAGDHLAVIDFSRKSGFTLDGLTFDLDGDGFVIVHADGTLWRWRPGSDAATRVGAFGTHTSPVSIGVRDGFVAGSYSDHVERVELATGKVDTAKIEADWFGLQNRGLMWINRTDGSLWKWERGLEPVDMKLPQPGRLFVGPDVLMIYTNQTMTLIRGDKRHVVPIASNSMGWDGGSLASILDAKGNASVVDLDTELSFPLPGTNYDQIDLYGDQVIVGDAAHVSIWSLTLPEDPAALHEWLATITNAKTIAGTEAYAWP